MKKLLLFTENYFRGGGNKYLIDTVNAIGCRFDSIVLAGNPDSLFPEDKARLKVDFNWQAVRILTKGRLMFSARSWPRPLKLLPWFIAFAFAPLMGLYNLLICIRLIVQVQPSIVLGCNGGYPGGHAVLALVIAARLCKVPVIMSVVSTPISRSGLGFYGRITDSLISWAVSLIIVNAEAVAEGMRELRGFEADKFRVVHNGLSDSSIKRQKEIDKVLIGCVSRMDRSKGIHFLLDAFNVVASDHPSSKLLLVGHGDASADLSRRIDELGLNDRVEMTGYYDGDINDILARIDIFVFPSLHEGFPYCILEAMRAGCAIIATKIGGIPEVISHEKNGLLVEAASTGELVDSIKLLCTDKSLRERLAASARESFLDDFTLDAMNNNLNMVFEKVGV